jgi:hypothetical protein
MMTNPNAQFYTEWDDQNLSPQENAFAHNLAIDLAEKLRIDGVTLDHMSDEQLAQFRAQAYDPYVMQFIWNQFADSIDENTAKLIANSAFDRAVELKALQALERETENQHFQARANNANRDRMVRVMPGPVLNPQPGKDLASGSIQRAAKGFWHKLTRATSLFSSDGYDLKTKEELRKQGKGQSFDSKVRDAQTDIVNNVEQKVALGETVRLLEISISELEGKIEGKSKQIDKLNDQFKNIKAAVREADIFLDDFRYSLRIEQLEKDYQSGTTADKVAGKVISNATFALFKRKGSEKYAKAYALQTEIEGQIMALEAKMKELLNVDLADSPVAENKNAQGKFNPDSITLREFQERQDNLVVRLEGLKARVESGIDHLKSEKARLTERVSSEKMQKLSNQADLKKIRKFEKNWYKLEGAEMERLFWYQFGNQITLIRDWQSALPKVNRMGRTVYQAQITAIFRQYITLREEVKKFEEVQEIVGMQALLDRELGTMKYNGSLISPQIQVAQENLARVRQALDIRKKYRDINGVEPLTGSIPGPAPTNAVPANTANTVPSNATITTPPAPVTAQGVVQPNAAPASQVNVAANVPSQPQVVGAAAPQIAPVQQVSIDQTAQATQVSVQGAVQPAIDPTKWVQLDLDFNKPQISVVGAVQPELQLTTTSAVSNAAPVVVTAQTAVTPEVTPAPTAAPEQIQPKEELISSVQLDELDKSVEIVRPAETLLVGDLNGSLKVLHDSLIAMKALEVEQNGTWKWTAGNRKVVLLGDILADRTAEGLKILDKVKTLREQAAKQGGDIKIIFGNHEDYAVSFLTERRIGGTGEDKDSIGSLSNAANPQLENSVMKFNWQGLGILEFIANYTNYGRGFNADIQALREQIEKDISNKDWTNLSNLPAEARAFMQNTESGQKLIDEMCQMKLVELDGDTLIIHTEPTNAILADLVDGDDLAGNIKRANETLQQSLRVLLGGTGLVPATGNFTLLMETFASADNRGFANAMGLPKNRENLNKLSAMGVKRIVHGHTPSNDAVRTYKAEQIEITNLDFGAGRPESVAGSLPVAVLGKRNQTAIGKDDVAKIESFDQNKQDTINEVGEWLNLAMPLLENEHDVWAIQIAETLNLKSPEEVKAKLTMEMAEFLQKMWNAVTDKPASPALSVLGKMINFYNEWIVVDKRPLSEKLAEIAAMGVPFGQAIIDGWRQKYGQKPQTTGEVLQATADAAANVVKEASQPAPEEKAAEEPKEAEQPKELTGITEEELAKLSSDELEKRALANISEVSGIRADAPQNMVKLVMDNAKLSAPKRYLNYINSLLLYPDVLALLFTFKYKGQKILKPGKIKTIDFAVKMNDVASSQVAIVLGQPDVLAKIKDFLKDKNEADIAKIFAPIRSMQTWFSTFVKK